MLSRPRHALLSALIAASAVRSPILSPGAPSAHLFSLCERHLLTRSLSVIAICSLFSVRERRLLTCSLSVSAVSSPVLSPCAVISSVLSP